MKEQFVTYEIAHAMKNLGFKEECFAVYISEDCLRFECLGQRTFTNDPSSWVSAPLWQQAIKWLESVKRTSVVRDIYDNNMWYIYSIKKDGFQGRRGIPNIENSQQDAILFALKRLTK